MRAFVAVVCLAGCSAGPSPKPAPANTATPSPSRAVAAPTVATAGAKTCTVEPAVLLGPHGEGDSVMGFDLDGGLAAWKPEKGVLAVQPIGRDGKPAGAPASIAVGEGIEPHSVDPRSDGFEVRLRRWTWQTQEERWWRVIVDRDGVHPPLAIDRVDARGEDVRSDDTIDVHVINAAVPPGRAGPGGMVIEAMGRPVLERTHHDKAVGEPLDLEYNGNPIAHGMNISTAIAWSGTHFLYPFWNSDGGPTHDKYAQRILPIDCRSRK